MREALLTAATHLQRTRYSSQESRAWAVSTSPAFARLDWMRTVAPPDAAGFTSETSSLGDFLAAAGAFFARFEAGAAALPSPSSSSFLGTLGAASALTGALLRLQGISLDRLERAAAGSPKLGGDGSRIGISKWTRDVFLPSCGGIHTPKFLIEPRGWWPFIDRERPYLGVYMNPAP